MSRYIVFLISLFFMHLTYASVEILLQPNPAQVGQELQLIIKQKGHSNTQGVPDISVLERDFQVVGTQQSMSYQSINGVSQHENIWTILLLPIHSGKIKIPSIMVGGEATPEREIEVLNEAQQIENMSAKADAKHLANVFMKWDIQPKRPVLHEAIKIKIHIYHAVPLLDAKLSLPKVQNGLLFSVDEPLHQVINQQGKRYDLESYEYFVYPQKLGKLTIHAPVLDALEYGVMPAPVRASLPSETLMVNPVPAKTTKEILPAVKLESKELSAAIKTPTLALGDALTRTIRLKAIGAPYHLIPDLDLNCGIDCKVYVRVKHTANKIVARALQGQKVFEITYIPNRVGHIKIPDVHIPWFNTEKRLMEQLTLPGFELFVSPEKSGLQETPSVSSKPPILKHIPTWLSIFLGLTLGILGALVYRKVDWSRLGDSLKHIEWRDRALQQACERQHANAARLALVNWAKKQFNSSEIYELHDILRNLPDDDFKQQIQKLIYFLYAKDSATEDWDGRALWGAYKRFSRSKLKINEEKKSSNGLNP